MINVIARENSLPFMKNEGLSYPTHLLKIGGSGIKSYLIEYELNKAKYLSDEMIFRYYWLQIKQNVYSIDTFRATVATQFIVKV